jgi:hypothetical protein
MLALAWALLERERLFAREQAARHAKVVEASKTPVVLALQGVHAS